MATTKNKNYVLVLDLPDSGSGFYFERFSCKSADVLDRVRNIFDALSCDMADIECSYLFEVSAEISLPLEDWQAAETKDNERTDIEDKLKAMETEMATLKTKLGALS